MICNLYTCLNLRNVLLFITYILFVSILVFSVDKAESNSINKSGVSIIIPNDTSQYVQVINNIRKGLKNNNEVIEVIYLSGSKKTFSFNLNNKKLVVLVGSKSFDFYLKSNSNSPYLTTLITRSAFNFIFNKEKNKNKFIGGIMIDQPSTRFVSLSKALIPNLKKTALILGPETIKNKRTILRGINKFKLKYDVLEILLQDNPVNKLRKAYEGNQALILFPDKKKFNRSLSRWILTLSYQYKIPVISYSIKYAKAGALASLFSTSEQIGRQTSEMINPFLRDDNIKPNRLVAPKYFDIYVNKSVGNALNLIIPSKNELLRKISN